MCSIGRGVGLGFHLFKWLAGKLDWRLNWVGWEVSYGCIGDLDMGIYSMAGNLIAVYMLVWVAV